MKGKTALLPEEKLAAAHAHLVYGVNQHVLAMIYGVNPGRIAEAITSIRECIGLVKQGDEADD
jgi:hypothetical protein